MKPNTHLYSFIHKITKRKRKKKARTSWEIDLGKRWWWRAKEDSSAARGASLWKWKCARTLRSGKGFISNSSVNSSSCCCCADVADNRKTRRSRRERGKVGFRGRAINWGRFRCLRKFAATSLSLCVCVRLLLQRFRHWNWKRTCSVCLPPSFQKWFTNSGLVLGLGHGSCCSNSKITIRTLHVSDFFFLTS